MAEENENASGSDSTGDKGEALVVASKLKNYIREKSGFNTSSAVIAVLSERVRRMCDEAIEKTKSDKRKTVMDRDFE